MVVRHQPTGDTSRIKLINCWRPAGSSTLLWAQDMATKLPLHLVEWGDELYLPVTEGLRLGIGVYNGSSDWRAYPTYIEGANLYDGGPAQPNSCTPSDMWETRPGQHMVMDALKNRDHHTGRPLVMVPHGIGLGIGEATFGTDEFRGQICVYERSRKSGYQPDPYGSGYGYTTRGGGGTKGGGFGGPPVTMGGSSRGGEDFEAMPTRGGPEIGTSRQVGIGAGAEDYRPSYQTGVQYERDTKLVAALRVESRADLGEVLARASHETINWLWSPNRSDWFTRWNPVYTATAPRVPVAPEPHRPDGANRGSGA